MYIVANYEVSLNGAKSEAKAIASLMAEKLNDKSLSRKTKFHVEDDRFFYDLDELQDLAVMMAKAAGSVGFTMKGCIDQSTLSGEYMDFEITYDGAKLICKNSCWYTEISGEDYEDYEEFSEEYCDDDGEPMFTEEQYAAMCEEPWFTLETSDGNVNVDEVPLTEITELTID